MSQREEDVQWDLEREAERRGIAVRRPPSKHRGEMQADWAVDAMRNRQLETYTASLAHADGLGGVQDIPADQFGAIVDPWCVTQELAAAEKREHARRYTPSTETELSALIEDLESPIEDLK